MAIKISSLSSSDNPGKLTDSEATFRDLALDFKMIGESGSKQLFSKEPRKDLASTIDYQAIDNSLFNIFNTSPGQKILNPRFGADLKRYLFQPVTEETAQLLGEVILQSIKLYEPRINVNEVFINAYPEEYMYTIDIHCTIPALKNKNYKYSGKLTDTGVTTSY
jgi:uncharacterized protein